MNRYFFSAFVLGTALSVAHAADTYTIDPTYSIAHFDIARVAFSAQRGSFNETSGTVVLDMKAKTGSVNFTIQTASIDMGSKAWSAHLRDEELFNVAKYPTMNFKSDKLIFDGEKVVAAQGQFTMLGVTKPIEIAVNNFQCGVSSVDKRQMCSANITATLKRSEYGLTRYIPTVSDEVSITVSVDAYKN